MPATAVNCLADCGLRCIGELLTTWALNLDRHGPLLNHISSLSFLAAAFAAPAKSSPDEAYMIPRDELINALSPFLLTPILTDT